MIKFEMEHERDLKMFRMARRKLENIACKDAIETAIREGFDGMHLTADAKDVLENLLAAINCNEVVISLVLDGIVGGVGAVLGFVPQMLVLFLLLSILEDVVYMSRIAFIMDRIFFCNDPRKPPRAFSVRFPG